MKRQAKQHIMNATREAIDPRLSGIEAQTAELQLNPQRDKLKPLIDINCNLAAGLSGRA